MIHAHVEVERSINNAAAETNKTNCYENLLLQILIYFGKLIKIINIERGE